MINEVKQAKNNIKLRSDIWYLLEIHEFYEKTLVVKWL